MEKNGEKLPIPNGRFVELDGESPVSKMMILRMVFWFSAGPTNGTVPAKEKRA